MSKKVMSAYAELMAKGKALGIAEERERLMIKTILNAYDNGIKSVTIRAITAESEERINHILKQYNRKS